MADAVRNFSDAPAPSNDTGYADAVDQVASHVRQLCFDDDTSEEGTAAAADGYSSDSSGETRSSLLSGAAGVSNYHRITVEFLHVNRLGRWNFVVIGIYLIHYVLQPLQPIFQRMKLNK